MSSPAQIEPFRLGQSQCPLHVLVVFRLTPPLLLAEHFDKTYRSVTAAFRHDQHSDYVFDVSHHPLATQAFIYGGIFSEQRVQRLVRTLAEAYLEITDQRRPQDEAPICDQRRLCVDLCVSTLPGYM